MTVTTAAPAQEHTNLSLAGTVIRLAFHELTPTGDARHQVLPAGRWVYIYGASPEGYKPSQREVHEFEVQADGTFRFSKLTASLQKQPLIREEFSSSYGADNVLFYTWGASDEMIYVFISPEQLHDDRITQYAYDTYGELAQRSVQIHRDTLLSPTDTYEEPEPNGTGADGTPTVDITEGVFGEQAGDRWRHHVVLRNHWQLALDLHEVYLEAAEVVASYSEGEKATKLFHAQMTKMAAQSFERIKRDIDDGTPAQVEAAERALSAAPEKWSYAWEIVRRDGPDGVLGHLRQVEAAMAPKDVWGCWLYGVVMASSGYRQASVDKLTRFMPSHVRWKLSERVPPIPSESNDIRRHVEQWLVEGGQDLGGVWDEGRTVLRELLTPCEAADHCKEGRERMAAMLSNELSTYYWVSSSTWLVRRALMIAAEIPGARLDEEMDALAKSINQRRVSALERDGYTAEANRQTGRAQSNREIADAARGRAGNIGGQIPGAQTAADQAGERVALAASNRDAAKAAMGSLDGDLAARLAQLDHQAALLDARLQSVTTQTHEVARLRRIVLEGRASVVGGLVDALGMTRPWPRLLIGNWQSLNLRWLFSQVRELGGALHEVLLDVGEVIDAQGAQTRASRTLTMLQADAVARQRRVTELTADVEALRARRVGIQRRERALAEQLHQAHGQRSLSESRLKALQTEHAKALEELRRVETVADQAQEAAARARSQAARAQQSIDNADWLMRRLRRRATVRADATGGWGRAAVAFHGVAILMSVVAVAQAQDRDQLGIESLGLVGAALDLATGLRLTGRGMAGASSTYAKLVSIGTAAAIAEVLYATIHSARAASRGDDDTAIGFGLIAAGAVTTIYGGALLTAMGFASASWIAGPVGIAVALIGVGIVMYCTDGPIESWLKTCYWSRDSVSKEGLFGLSFLSSVKCEQTDFGCQLTSLMQLYLQPKLVVRLEQTDGSLYDPREHSSPAWLVAELTPPSLFDPTRMRYTLSDYKAKTTGGGLEVSTGGLLGHGVHHTFDEVTREIEDGPLTARKPYALIRKRQDVVPDRLNAETRVGVTFLAAAGTLSKEAGPTYDLLGEVGQWEYEVAGAMGMAMGKHEVTSGELRPSGF